MQLDRTRIAIRERGVLETLDLALQVTRAFAGPLAICSLLAVVPLALINYALVGWMAPAQADDEITGFRYLWNMSALIFLEAPLASAFVIAWLGPALFLEQKTVQQVVNDVFRRALQLAWTHGLLRGVFVAWFLFLLVTRDQSDSNALIEVVALTMLLSWSAALRAFRPYITEIVLLEHSPLWPRRQDVLTIGRRSAHLHAPTSGDLVARWCGTAAIVVLLVLLTLVTAFAALGFLISDWPFHVSTEPFEMASNLDWFKLQIVFPACLWLIVLFVSVVRFLGYLDLRIRLEGWEIELLMRAESLRLAAQLD
jgi:hypothetical protein